MERREFLRSTTALAMAAAGGVALGGVVGVASADAATNARRYRGTRNGKVYVSRDNGRTWRLLTNFGSKLDATRVGRSSGKVVANLFLGHRRSFKVALQPDGHTWRTI